MEDNDATRISLTLWKIFIVVMLVSIIFIAAGATLGFFPKVYEFFCGLTNCR